MVKKSSGLAVTCVATLFFATFPAMVPPVKIRRILFLVYAAIIICYYTNIFYQKSADMQKLI